MISERSCDTEDWSNDAENSAAHLMNKLHIQIYSNINRLFFNQINAAFSYWPPTYEQ